MPSTDIKDYYRRAWGLGDRVPFKYGGTWADWKVHYEDQMSFEEYLQDDKITKKLHALDKRADGGRIGQLVQPNVDGSRPGYSGDTTTRKKIIKFLEGKKEIHSTELREFLDKKGFTGQRAADMQHKKWFKDLNIKYIQDPNPMLYGEKKGRLNIPKARKTVYNKYAALFHKEQPKKYLSANWSDLTYNQRQDISSIAKSNDYKFKVKYSRRKRFNPTKEKKLIDVFELTEQNFLDHGKYGVKRSLANGKTNPEYTKIHNYVQNDFKFPKKDLLPVKMQRQIMNTFDLPEGVTEWKFDEYKYGVPDTRGKNMNLGKRIANSLREIKSWKISTDWSKPNGWMMYSMYRASNNDMRLPNGKLAYEPKYEMIDGERKIIGFTDNTPAGGGKTYYGLKKWNKKYKGTDWASHGDFKKTSKFVDITKKAYAQPNEVIMGLLEKGGIPRNGKLQLNHVLKFLAQQEGYDIERLKNAIVKHHMGGVGAGKVIGNPTNDLQILKVTTNNAIREIENKIRQGIYLKDDITTLKNYGASVRGPDGKLYGGGSKTASGGFRAIEKGAEQAIKKWEPKHFESFKKYLNIKDQSKLSSTIQSIMSKQNSGLNVVDIARWGRAELSALDDIAGKLPSKVLGAFGRLLKGVGVAAIPVDAVEFTAAHSRGLTPDVGAMNLAEIYSNLPGMIWEAGEWVASKVQGKEHEWKPFYEFDFGKDYQTKKYQETPIEVLEKRVDRFATDMVPQEDLEQVSSYLDRRGIPGITDENVQLQQYEAELLERMRKEKALADQKKKEERLTGVDKYILSNLDV